MSKVVELSGAHDAVGPDRDGYLKIDYVDGYGCLWFTKKDLLAMLAMFEDEDGGGGRMRQVIINSALAGIVVGVADVQSLCQWSVITLALCALVANCMMEAE